VRPGKEGEGWGGRGVCEDGARGARKDEREEHIERKGGSGRGGGGGGVREKGRRETRRE